MALGELIYGTDTLNQGRIKINNFYSGTSAIWSSSTGAYSVIRSDASGAIGNIAQGFNSMAAGFANRASGNHSIAFWGSGNTATTVFSSVFAGRNNRSLSAGATIIAGSGNTISASSAYGAILNGVNNTVETGSKYATIINGRANLAKGNYSLVSGFLNTAWTQHNIAIGGRYNSVSGDSTFNPAYNNYYSDNSIIGGGGASINGTNPGKNLINNASKSAIIGGIGGQIFDGSKSSVILGSGFYNTSSYGSTKARAVISGASQNSSIISSINVAINAGGRNSIITSEGNSTITGGLDNLLAASNDSTIINSVRGVMLSSAASDLKGTTSAIIAGSSCSLSGAGTGGNNVIIGTASSRLNQYVSGNMFRSSIVGGSGNQIKVTGGTMSQGTIIGGISNTILSTGSSSNNIILGGYTNSLNKYIGGTFGGNSIVGGNTNKIHNRVSTGNVKNNFVGGGNLNFVFSNSLVASYNNAIVGGFQNSAHTRHSGIVGGVQNQLKPSSYGMAIVGGSGNTTSSTTKYGAMAGGQSNLLSINSHYSFIGGGRKHSIGSNYGANFCAIIGGSGNTITGSYVSSYGAIIGGQSNKIAAPSSARGSVVIGGRNNTIYHSYSVAMGGGSQTRAAGGLSDGTCQLVIGNQPTLASAVGNNRIRLDAKAGQGVASVSFVTGTADYAEYFEWLDKNKNNENRLGYFVSLIDGKIQIGNSNIIGIVSSAPGFIGDAAELAWDGMYAKDEWNREIVETYKSYSWTENEESITVFEDINGRKMTQYPNPGHPTGVDFDGEISISATTGTTVSPKMNPNYDPNGDYTPRSQRKEWAPVGLLGKLHVRTAEPITGKSIDVNAQGLAINGNKHMVLNVVRPHTNSQYGIVRVFFK